MRPGSEGLGMKRFTVGSRVTEPTYGLGSVIAVEGAFTRIEFDESGVKKFLTRLSRLERSTEAASGKGKKKVRRKRKTTKQ